MWVPPPGLEWASRGVTAGWEAGATSAIQEIQRIAGMSTAAPVDIGRLAQQISVLLADPSPAIRNDGFLRSDALDTLCAALCSSGARLSFTDAAQVLSMIRQAASKPLLLGRGSPRDPLPLLYVFLFSALLDSAFPDALVTSYRQDMVSVTETLSLMCICDVPKIAAVCWSAFASLRSQLHDSTAFPFSFAWKLDFRGAGFGGRVSAPPALPPPRSFLEHLPTSLVVSSDLQLRRLLDALLAVSTVCMLQSGPSLRVSWLIRSHPLYVTEAPDRCASVPSVLYSILVLASPNFACRFLCAVLESSRLSSTSIVRPPGLQQRPTPDNASRADHLVDKRGCSTRWLDDDWFAGIGRCAGTGEAGCGHGADDNDGAVDMGDGAGGSGDEELVGDLLCMAYLLFCSYRWTDLCSIIVSYKSDLSSFAVDHIDAGMNAAVSCLRDPSCAPFRQDLLGLMTVLSPLCPPKTVASLVFALDVDSLAPQVAQVFRSSRIGRPPEHILQIADTLAGELVLRLTSPLLLFLAWRILSHIYADAHGGCCIGPCPVTAAAAIDAACNSNKICSHENLFLEFFRSAASKEERLQWMTPLLSQSSLTVALSPPVLEECLALVDDFDLVVKHLPASIGAVVRFPETTYAPHAEAILHVVLSDNSSLLSAAASSSRSSAMALRVACLLLPHVSEQFVLSRLVSSGSALFTCSLRLVPEYPEVVGLFLARVMADAPALLVSGGARSTSLSSANGSSHAITLSTIFESLRASPSVQSCKCLMRLIRESMSASPSLYEVFSNAPMPFAWTSSWPTATAAATSVDDAYLLLCLCMADSSSTSIRCAAFDALRQLPPLPLSVYPPLLYEIVAKRKDSLLQELEALFSSMSDSSAVPLRASRHVSTGRPVSPTRNGRGPLHVLHRLIPVALPGMVLQMDKPFYQQLKSVYENVALTAATTTSGGRRVVDPGGDFDSNGDRLTEADADNGGGEHFDRFIFSSLPTILVEILLSSNNRAVMEFLLVEVLEKQYSLPVLLESELPSIVSLLIRKAPSVGMQKILSAMESVLKIVDSSVQVPAPAGAALVGPDAVSELLHGHFVSIVHELERDYFAFTPSAVRGGSDSRNATSGRLVEEGLICLNVLIRLLDVRTRSFVLKVVSCLRSLATAYGDSIKALVDVWTSLVQSLPVDYFLQQQNYSVLTLMVSEIIPLSERYPLEVSALLERLLLPPAAGNHNALLELIVPSLPKGIPFLEKAYLRHRSLGLSMRDETASSSLLSTGSGSSSRAIREQLHTLVQSLQQQQQQQQPHQQSSMPVRKFALARTKDLLSSVAFKSSSSLLYELLWKEDSSSILFRLSQALLSMVSLPGCGVTACECLGLLGAIDPSLFSPNSSMPMFPAAFALSSSSFHAPGVRGQQLQLDETPEELAIVLMTDFLVPLMTNSSNKAATSSAASLGGGLAANRSTSGIYDRACYAIQELLKFLESQFADSKEEAVADGNGGGSLKRLLENFMSQSTLEIILPLRSSGFRLKSSRLSSLNADSSSMRGQRSLLPRLLAAGAAMPSAVNASSWMVDFYKFLIGHLSLPSAQQGHRPVENVAVISGENDATSLLQLPQEEEDTLRKYKTVFEACRAAVRDDAAMTIYLLPHLCRCRLSSPDHVYREILAVLAVADRSICSAIFGIVDSLEGWWNTAAVAAATAAATTTSKTSTSSTNHPRGQRSAPVAAQPRLPSASERRRNAEEEFLRNIPRHSLAEAAYRVGDYSRALRYYEQYHHPHCNPPGGCSGASHAERQQCLYERTAAADAVFSLQFLRRVYAKLDDVDLLEAAGSVASSNVAASGAPSDNSKIEDELLVYEKRGDWAKALTCYEIILHHSFLPAQQPQRMAMQMGMLRCLCNLGHFMQAKEHAEVLLAQLASPGLVDTGAAPAAIAVATDALMNVVCEASWKLGLWDAVPVGSGKNTSNNNIGGNGNGNNNNNNGIGGGYIAGPNININNINNCYYLTSSIVGNLVSSNSTNVGLFASIAALAGPIAASWERRYNEFVARALIPSTSAGEALECIRAAREVLVGPLSLICSSGAGAESLSYGAGATHVSAVAGSGIGVGGDGAIGGVYQQCYPILVRLHCLQDLEFCHQVSRSSSSSSAAVVAAAAMPDDGACSLFLSARLGILEQSPSAREPVLSVHRSLFYRNSSRTQQQQNDGEKVAETWLQLGKVARKEGLVQTAEAAILHARAAASPGGAAAASCLLAQAKILRGVGVTHQALQLLKNNRQPMQSQQFGAVHLKLKLAESWWQWETRSRPFDDLVGQFKKMREMHSDNEKVLYLFAMVLDDYVSPLIASLREQASRRHHSAGAAAGGGRGAAGAATPAVTAAVAPGGGAAAGRSSKTTAAAAATAGQTGSSAATNGSGINLEKFPEIERYLHVALRLYADSLCRGTRHIYESLPRLLTLWLDNAEFFSSLYQSMSASPSLAGGGGAGARKEQLLQLVMTINQKIVLERIVERLPAFELFVVLPQMVSRICVGQDEARSLLIMLLANVLSRFPSHASWYIVPQQHGCKGDRSKYAGEVIQMARSRMDSETASVFQTFQEMQRHLVALTEMNPGDKVQQISLSQHFAPFRRMFPLSRIAMPVERVMRLQLPPRTQATKWRKSAVALVDEDWNPFPDEMLFMSSVEDQVKVMRSLVRPKVVKVVGSDSQSYSMLLKGDDMRKDMRLLEFCNVVNRLFQKDPESRRRNLYIRTFCVFPLGDKNGVVEWVPDTDGFKHICERLAVRYNGGKPLPDPQSVAAVYTDATLDDATRFLKVLVPMFPLIFHHFFLENFLDPASWYVARQRFVRTTAVWSMVGSILGLGDRHGENILVDNRTGDMVQVDFDALFNKAQTFQIKERVPFRLTRNMVDGFGVTGVEGTFRRSSETTLAVLRKNKRMLLNVLETFVHDPLLDFSKKADVDVEHMNPERALRCTSDRLDGIIEEKTRIPFSVPGQVNRLIQQATDPANLGAMYRYWLPAL